MKADYRNWRKLQLDSFGGYVSVNFQPLVQNPDKAMEVSPEEREREFEFRWRSGGLCFYTSFRDLLTDPEANEELANFFRRKLEAKIDDPATADKLIPRGYPILTKRLCADDGYFEAFNRDNVSLIDVGQHPIDRIQPRGVEVAGELYELDDLVFATGFDAVTGALTNIDIRGVGGRSLEEEWSDGPRTNAGLMTSGFPNMFFVNGPGSCTGFFNPVLNAEFQGDWLAEMLETMRERGKETVDSQYAADDAWTRHLAEVARPTLFWNSNNWYIGANVPGKAKVMLLYLGGFSSYRKHLESVRQDDYEGFSFSTPASRTAAASG